VSLPLLFPLVVGELVVVDKDKDKGKDKVVVVGMVVDMVVDMVEVVDKVERHKALVEDMVEGMVEDMVEGMVEVVGKVEPHMVVGQRMVVEHKRVEVEHKLEQRLGRSSYNDGDKLVVVEVVEELELLGVQEVLVALVAHHILPYLVLQGVLVVPWDQVLQVLQGVQVLLVVLVLVGLHQHLLDRIRMQLEEGHKHMVVEEVVVVGHNKLELECSHMGWQISSHLERTIFDVH